MYLGLFLQLLSLVNAVYATISLVSVESERYREHFKSTGVSGLSQFLKHVSAEEPVIILKFDKFNLYGEFASSRGGQYPFLEDYLDSDSHLVLNNDEDISQQDSYSSIEIAQLPEHVTDGIKLKIKDTSDVLLMRFSEGQYNLDMLDRFLLETYQHFGELVPKLGSLVFQFPEHDSKSSDFSVSNMAKKSPEEQDSGSIGITKVQDEDTDADKSKDELSKTWTEGLLSCLLVSLLLLFILVVATSWVLSLDISYGALEKSTNPLKKTN
ncbi:Voa1p Ecym_4425 [Eremothecium cymbalariae DBVPG|uniref:V-type proton ATPase subunit S1/VOA1 transmembrane domain-containing protein n=1 Tax=Eremothecium cymbalariae (strain CBS 270.75 / DBVPG 7215 / KCTC 17166 / NRRL Y-17582) TaxID=931890 RepID=G8JTX1_ERECY|nr:hypothetical protein Ecym_4425 [Eremothecium cymbalariae DBVPG\